MSFREKSAWLMVLALLVSGGFYFWFVAQMSAEIGAIAPPLIPIVIVYVIVLTVLSVFGHTLFALLSPKEASAAFDERDRQIETRAGSFAGPVLVTGIVLSLGAYLMGHGGNAMFHAVLASLMIAQTTEYLCQIYLYRRSF